MEANSRESFFVNIKDISNPWQNFLVSSFLLYETVLHFSTTNMQPIPWMSFFIWYERGFAALSSLLSCACFNYIYHCLGRRTPADDVYLLKANSGSLETFEVIGRTFHHDCCFCLWRHQLCNCHLWVCENIVFSYGLFLLFWNFNKTQKLGN